MPRLNMLQDVTKKDAENFNQLDQGTERFFTATVQPVTFGLLL